MSAPLKLDGLGRIDLERMIQTLAAQQADAAGTIGRQNAQIRQLLEETAGLQLQIESLRPATFLPHPLRFYLAGGSADVVRCAGWIEWLTKSGLTCTFDWTAEVKKAQREGKTDTTLTSVQRLSAAWTDAQAVLAADLIWLVVPKEGASRGCWFESGVAWALREMRPSVEWVVSGDDGRSIFTELASRTFARHEDAAEWILATARGIAWEGPRNGWPKGPGTEREEK